VRQLEPGREIRRAKILSICQSARRWHLIPLALASWLALQPGALQAQRAVDLQAGSWSVSGPNPTLYSAGLGRWLAGPLAYTVRGLAIVDPDSSQRSLYGLGPEISLFRGTRVLWPYAVAGAALAVQSSGSANVAAVWNAGIGLEYNPWAWLGLDVEANYFAEDLGLRGFWRLAESDRRGLVFSARVSFRWGGPSIVSGSEGALGTDSSEFDEPASSTPRSSEPVGDVAALRERVAETALAAMGEPYRWGGTSTEEGFDCSGLVWYAYDTHGVSVPRTSRDQAGAGSPLAANASALEPGDILLFAESGSRVTHVGLYVGNARFIHSTNSGGVKVSRLSGSGDANDRWWFARWVGARRVLEGS
jgi:hypothetical protein